MAGVCDFSFMKLIVSTFLVDRVKKCQLKSEKVMLISLEVTADISWKSAH